MLRTAIIVAIAAVVGTGCQTPTGPTGPHVQDVLIAKGVPVAQTEINGVPTMCVVDTGNASFVVSEDFGGTAWTGFGEPDVVDITSLVVAGWQFSGGAITGSDAVFSIWEDELGVEDIGCVLGNGVLGVTRFTVDYAHSRIELADPNARVMTPEGLTGDELVIDAIYDELLLVGSVNIADDFDGIFAFDSGAGFVTLAPETYSDLDSPPTLSEQGEIPYGTLSSMSVLDNSVTDVAFITWDDPQIPAIESVVGLRVDGTVGASLLAGYAVTWDFPNGQMMLRPYEDDVRTGVFTTLSDELGF